MIEEIYVNSNTLKSVLKNIRRFLTYHKAKYNVTDNDLYILNLSGLDNYGGGKPINHKDLNIIYKEFVNRQYETEYSRLYTIVFEILINSNLRFGEILNLKKKLHKL